MKKEEKKRLEELRGLRDQANALAHKLEELYTEAQLPFIQEEVSRLLAKKKLKKVTTAWLQKKYKLGYASASRLLDNLGLGK